MALWRDVIERRIARVHDSRQDKRMSIAEAVRRFVRPGIKLHPVSLHTRPTALCHEICRQFAGKDPRFELVGSSLAGTYLELAALGLLRRAVVSFAGEGYPTPGPSPIIARATADGLEIENWTMLTMSLRLLAGAMGVPFLPTRSISGSSIADENAGLGTFAEIDDPFEPGHRQGVVRAYRPDLAFMHVWAADPAGNAVCFPPHQENVYGAIGAREGVILSAHHVVDTDFVRRYSHLVRIPAELVVAVCEAPYGSHPYGNYAQGAPELEAHANDYPFMREHRRAQDSREAYERWLHEWVLDVPDHAAYLAKLGPERIRRLHKLAAPESWREELEEHAAALDAARPAGAVEEMIIQGAREAAHRIRAGRIRTVLSGVGQATLLAWLASHFLRDEGVEFAMMAETGMYGHDPRPADPFLINYRNMPTTTLLTDIFEILGMHGGGASNRCLATIGAGQLDRHGNINSTRGRDGGHLVGSGGANDIASSAQEVVVVAAQRRETFAPKLEYVTTPGTRVSCVISTMGRFEKRGGELVLTGWFESAAPTREAAIARIRERCGWDLMVADELEALAPPTEEELALLRVYDPERFFLGKPG
jgi:acyl CoA:acetate/3-ketoacid CoA transferase alpha subunit/acyl CoA:acetate/3-ketoacid CoA transferase beta subunit